MSVGMGGIHYYIRSLLDFVSPRVCVMCGRRLAVAEEVLCAGCNLLLPRTYLAEAPDDANRLCTLFIASFHFIRSASWFYYTSQSPQVSLIHMAKYYGGRELCHWLGTSAAQEMVASGFFIGIDVIVPLPLTWRRQLSRGYNQSYLIARGVREVTGIPIARHAVRRVKFRQSQTHLSGEDRMSNVRGAFRLIRPKQLQGKHILLIDDVMTTGATIASCGHTISKAGDVTISVLTIGLAHR